MADEAEVKVTRHTKQVLSELEAAVYDALEAIGTNAELYAKRDCPVDTGRLRNSITFATKKMQSEANTNKDPKGQEDAQPDDYKTQGKPEDYAVYLGTNVSYAPSVEYRDVTHKTGKAHFLKNAIANHAEEFKRLAKERLEK